MKKVMIFAAVAALCGTFTACGTADKTPVSLNGEWKVETVANQKASGETEPFIGFNEEEKRIYGSASCNRIMGSYEIDGKKLKFDQVGMTRMMCVEMATEEAIIKAINETTEFSVKKDILTLKDAEGKEIMQLSKKETVSE